MGRKIRGVRLMSADARRVLVQDPRITAQDLTSAFILSGDTLDEAAAELGLRTNELDLLMRGRFHPQGIPSLGQRIVDFMERVTNPEPPPALQVAKLVSHSEPPPLPGKIVPIRIHFDSLPILTGYVRDEPKEATPVLPRSEGDEVFFLDDSGVEVTRRMFYERLARHRYGPKSVITLIPGVTKTTANDWFHGRSKPSEKSIYYPAARALYNSLRKEPASVSEPTYETKASDYMPSDYMPSQKIKAEPATLPEQHVQPPKPAVLPSIHMQDLTVGEMPVGTWGYVCADMLIIDTKGQAYVRKLAKITLGMEANAVSKPMRCERGMGYVDVSLDKVPNKRWTRMPLAQQGATDLDSLLPVGSFIKDRDA